MRPVLQAKVPIIKFVVNNKYEADLSFSNYLNCKIAKADSGGISSYAFAILLIHYMQQKNYLPVLQELYEGEDRPIVRAGEWNIWYQDDMEIIHKLWKPPPADVLVADMWLGFFRYYLFDFDRERYVVTINQKALLERIAKLWNSLLAIEVLAHVLNSFYKVSLFSLQEIGPKASSAEKENKRGGRLRSAGLPQSVPNRPQQRARNSLSSDAIVPAGPLPHNNWNASQSAVTVHAAQALHNNVNGPPPATSAYRGRFPYPPPQSGLLGHRPNGVSPRQPFVPPAGHRSFTSSRFTHHTALRGGGVSGPNDHFGQYSSNSMNQSAGPAPLSRFEGLRGLIYFKYLTCRLFLDGMKRISNTVAYDVTRTKGVS
ncbi:unnamed protein product, partial [Dibothriocephalus latus]